MKRPYNIDSDILLELELNLNQIQYRDVPTGSLLSQFLIIELQYGYSDYTFRGLLKDLFFRAYIYVLGSRWSRKKKSVFPDNFKNKILFTVIEERPNLLGMIKPITDTFSTNEFYVFSYSDHLNNLFWGRLIAWNQIPPINHKIWRKNIKLLKKDWIKKIDKWREKHGISLAVKTKIINNLFSQTIYLESLINFLSIAKPKLIVTESDRYFFCSALISAGNKLNIPTVTLLHGVISDNIGYTPLIADKILVWGEQQAKKLKKLGVLEEQISICGAPHLTRERILNKEDILSKLDLRKSKPVVLLGSCNIDEHDMHKLVTLFCEGLNSCENYTPVIKLHRSESKELYASEIKKYHNVRFFSHDEITLEESLSIADYVCAYNSAYTIDALVKGIPLIIIDIQSAEPGIADELINDAKCMTTSCAKQIPELIEKFQSNTHFASVIMNNQETYVREFCQYFGKESANVIQDYLYTCINSTLQT